MISPEQLESMIALGERLDQEFKSDSLMGINQAGGLKRSTPEGWGLIRSQAGATWAINLLG